MGVPLGHSVLAIKSMTRGLGKMNVNPAALDADLEANWAVVAEAVQTILRREGYPNPYEALKAYVRYLPFYVNTLTYLLTYLLTYFTHVAGYFLSFLVFFCSVIATN